MELISILSKVVQENITTKKILLEYPESTIVKLVEKFSQETEDTEEEIRKTILDFERFKQAFNNEDKDIFKHSYTKVKSLVNDRINKQKSKKNLEDLVQDYLNTWRDQYDVDLQLTKQNIKKFFEIKTNLPKLKQFKQDVTSYNPFELRELVEKYFSNFDNDGSNELVNKIAEKFIKELPEEDPITTIIPRARRFVRFFDNIPLNTKLSSFMNFEEFEHVVDGNTPMEESEYDVPEVDVSDVDIPYEDDDVLIFAPDQKHKCINIRKKHAPERKWCTSWEGSGNYYYNYRLNQNLTLYYIINKNLPTSDLNYASVVLVDKYGDMRLADGSNSGRYAGGTRIPWSEILEKIPVLDGKKDYLEAKPYSPEEEKKLKRLKSYDLTTTDPMAELGGEEEVELWLELRSPNLSKTKNGDQIFANLPEEIQKKYIGLGNELSAAMVRVLSPSAMSYYISKKKEKLLQKNLKELQENDMEIILSKEMKPYYKALKEKFSEELRNVFSVEEYLSISYPDSVAGKYIRLFGLENIFELLPEDINFFQLENKSNEPVIFDIPESIGRFTQIGTLVFENCINKLPESFGKLKNLHFLNLTNNSELTELPSSIVNLTCLDFISIMGTPINPESLPEEMKEYVTIDGEFWNVHFPEEMKTHCIPDI